MSEFSSIFEECFLQFVAFIHYVLPSASSTKGGSYAALFSEIQKIISW